jgi:hypothetical protein
LSASYPHSWGSLPTEIVSEFEESGFELGMDALRAEAEHTQAALIDMGIYFASFRLWPGTNRYLALVKFLQSLGPQIEFSFGSLNYETYLEQSLERAGFDILYWGDPPQHYDHAFTRVTKPHGSCHFVVDTGTNTFINNRFVGGQAYIAGAPLKVVPLEEVEAASKTGFPSAMSLYAPGKPNLICPEFVGKFHAEWEAQVEGADILVAIGARPMFESDPHIWVPIKDSSAPMCLLGGHDEGLERELGTRLTILGETFAAALDPLREWIREAIAG